MKENRCAIPTYSSIESDRVPLRVPTPPVQLSDEELFANNEELLPPVPEQLETRAEDQKTTDIRLLKIERIASFLYSLKITNETGLSSSVALGYNAQSIAGKPCVYLGYKRKDGSIRPFAKPFFTHYGGKIFPYIRAEFDHATPLRVYSNNPKHNPFVHEQEATLLLTTKEAVKTYFDHWLNGLDGRIPLNELQDAWDTHVWQECEAARRNNIFPTWILYQKHLPLPTHQELIPSKEVMPAHDPEWVHGIKKTLLTYDALINTSSNDPVATITSYRKGSAYDPYTQARLEERKRNVQWAIDYKKDRIRKEEVLRYQDFLKNKNIPKDVSFLDVPELPFRSLIGGGLSNGNLRIPKERPYGKKAWDQHADVRPLQTITKESWPTLLDIGDGLYHKDFPTVPNRVREKLLRERQEEKDRVYKEKIAGKCIDLNILTEITRPTVSFGKRFLITGKNLHGEELSIVDSPNYGVALYVFKERLDAIEWASELINHEEAKRRAIRCIPHIPGWEERARETIQPKKT